MMNRRSFLKLGAALPAVAVVPAAADVAAPAAFVPYDPSLLWASAAVTQAYDWGMSIPVPADVCSLIAARNAAKKP